MPRCGPCIPACRFAGVGGRTMAAQGFASPFDDRRSLDRRASASVPRKLPLILRRIRETADAIIAAQPDALVIIDSPDFTHRVARRVRAAAPDIPIINYAPPTVWAWRPWRARAMRRYVDEVLAILPFEPAAFARLDGPPCTYVGHPLAERIDAICGLDAGEVARNSRSAGGAGLPGSRRSEIRRLAAIFGAAIGEVAGTKRSARARAADVAAYCRSRLREATANWPVRPRIVVDAGGETCRVPPRPRRARGVRHGHAGAGACAGADGRRLSGPGMGSRCFGLLAQSTP